MPPLPLPDAVVFDFDGVLLDTETPLFQAWAHVFELHGAVAPTLEEWSVCVGAANGALDVLALLRGRAQREVDGPRVQKLRREHTRQLLEVEVVLPGVEDWLAEAGARGIPCAIASSSPPDWVHGHLERLGLARHFAAVACAGDGLPGKPAPDLYLEACRRLGVRTQRSLAIEDSPNGLAAARAAGLACLAVPNSVTAGLDLSAAHLRARSLAELALPEVGARLAHRWRPVHTPP